MSWLWLKLRAAPVTAALLGLLTLLTALLAAAAPRAVEDYRTDGLRSSVTEALSSHTVLEVVGRPRGKLDEDLTALAPDSMRVLHELLRDGEFGPLAMDRSQARYGARTVERGYAFDEWLARPDGLEPQFRVDTPEFLADHAEVVAGRLPDHAVGERDPAAPLEAVVTETTAQTLGISSGDVIEQAGPLPFEIVGVIAPRATDSGYWALDTLFHTPQLDIHPALDNNSRFWVFGLLLAPEAAPALHQEMSTESYWTLPPATGGLGAPDLPALQRQVASFQQGAALNLLRQETGRHLSVQTRLDEVLADHQRQRDVLAPITSVATVGVGVVTLVVMVMAGHLTAARRHTELGQLRARGGSYPGILRRLLSETAVVTVPAAALGWLLAAWLIPGTRALPSLLAAGGTALIATVAMPLAALLRRANGFVGQRADVMSARPSPRRTVAELTLVLVAVGAVLALRQRGTGSGTSDAMSSAAPVLIGLIAALLLVRLYPLPLRLAGRAAARSRGLIGFVSLARHGRASGTAVLPLLALITAVTTAAFGGSVLAGVAEGRDRAAVTSVGADVRIWDVAGFTAAERAAVAAAPGVTESVEVLSLGGRRIEDSPAFVLLTVDPRSYARHSAEVSLGAFDPALLAGDADTDGSGDPDSPLPVLASPAMAEALGEEPHQVGTEGGEVTVQVAGTLPRTPAADGNFLVIGDQVLPEQDPDAAGANVLLLTGSGIDGERAAELAGAADRPNLAFAERAAERRELAASPMNAGVVGVFGTAMAAGGALAALTVVLALLQSAPERQRVIARLRTMGMTPRQGRGLLALESVPLVLLASLGGMLAGITAVQVLGQSIDLSAVAVADAGGGLLDAVRLRLDPLALLLPLTALVAVAAAAMALQLLWSGRRADAQRLRADDQD
jgi:putative ABC transport system permease protein